MAAADRAATAATCGRRAAGGGGSGGRAVCISRGAGVWQPWAPGCALRGAAPLPGVEAARMPRPTPGARSLKWGRICCGGRLQPAGAVSAPRDGHLLLLLLLRHHTDSRAASRARGGAALRHKGGRPGDAAGHCGHLETVRAGMDGRMGANATARGMPGGRAKKDQGGGTSGAVHGFVFSGRQNAQINSGCMHCNTQTSSHPLYPRLALHNKVSSWGCSLLQLGSELGHDVGTLHRQAGCRVCTRACAAGRHHPAA